jgi:hypothetical protein
MNSLTTSKPMTKPLKGGMQAVSVGVFDTLSINSLKLETIDIAGIIEDSILTNVTIKDSEIINTVIGIAGPNVGYFTEIQTNNDVTMLGNNLGESVLWDASTGIFTINGELDVNGCSQLGNIRICNNDIRSTNLNGEINILPNGLGNLNIRAPVDIRSSNGSFLLNMSNGGYTNNIQNNIQNFSSRGNIQNTSYDSQIYTARNGDIIFNVDTNATVKNIITTLYTDGNIIINTSVKHELTNGNIVFISNGLLNNNFTVSNIINDTSFRLTTTTGITSINTGGTLLKNLDKNIILNSKNKIIIPELTKVEYGEMNWITGGTIGIRMTSREDIILETTNGSVRILESRPLTFGNNSNTVIGNTTGITLTTEKLDISSNNVEINDPIIKLSKTPVIINDMKDRGIEFNYNYETSGSKLGWFGLKNNTERFTFITNATNTNEIITGTKGDIDIRKLFSETVEITSSLEMACNNINNVNTINGCNNKITLDGTENVEIKATEKIYLNGITQINENQNFLLGTSGNLIRSNGKVEINSISTIDLNGISINIPQTTLLNFGTSNTTYLVKNTSGELIINNNNNLNLNITNGSINIQNTIPFKIGDSIIVNNTSGFNIHGLNKIHLETTNGNIELFGNNIIIKELSKIKLHSFTNTSGAIYINNTNDTNIDSINDIILTSNTNNIYLNAGNINLKRFSRLNFTENSFNYITSDTKGLIITSNEQEINIINTGGSINTSSFINNITSNRLYIENTNTTIKSSSIILDSNDVKITDPIIKLANYNVIDIKDRGVEFNYYDVSSGSYKLGWFGMKNNTGRFTFIINASNNNEVITGDIGNVELGNVSLTNITLVSSGNLDLNCGNITSVGKIIGCGGFLEIEAANNITLKSNNLLCSSGNINIINGNITVGTSYITSNTNGNMTFTTINDLTFSGNDFNIDNSNVNIKDPIITLGEITIQDNKDRGIEWRWFDGITPKWGFSGYKSSEGKFVFIKDGINTNEVYSGIYGDILANDMYINNINLSSGNILGNTINLIGNSTNISNTLTISNTGNQITTNTNGDMVLISSNLDLLTLNTNIYNNLQFIGGGVLYSTNGNLVIENTTGNILLNTELIGIETNSKIYFSNTSNNIWSDSNELYINGYNGVNISSANITLNGDITINGNISAGVIDFDLDKYILPLGTSNYLDIINIQNGSTLGNILITTHTNGNLSIGDIVEIKQTNSSPNIDGIYNIINTISTTQFEINIPLLNLSQNGTTGKLKTNLTQEQGKDVGIQVNYWSTTGNPLITNGSLGYKTGFFGFKRNTERWSFYNNATISNNIVSGNFGDIEINKLFTNSISGFILDGGITGGSNLISGTNFNIQGGNINNTPIGANTANTGRFTNLSNTVSALLNNLTLSTTLVYNLSDVYTLSSIGTQFRSPSMNFVVSLFNVSGVNYTSSSGTMPTTGISPGTFKMLVCNGMGVGCSHTIFFGANKLFAPNPLDQTNTNPISKIIFESRGQSVQLLFDGISWIMLNTGVYVE